MISLLIITILILAISTACFYNQQLFYRLAARPQAIVKRQQWFRLFTHGFVHADLTHLLVNLLVLFFFLPSLETNLYELFNQSAVLSVTAALTIFVLGVIVSIIPSVIRNKHRNDYTSVGASGGVAAVLFAFIVFQPLSIIALYGVIPLPAIAWGLIYLGYSYYQDRNDNRSRINHNAHLWGSLWGGGVGVILLVVNAII